MCSDFIRVLHYAAIYIAFLRYFHLHYKNIIHEFIDATSRYYFILVVCSFDQVRFKYLSFNYLFFATLYIQ